MYTYFFLSFLQNHSYMHTYTHALTHSHSHSHSHHTLSQKSEEIDGFFNSAELVSYGTGKADSGSSSSSSPGKSGGAGASGGAGVGSSVNSNEADQLISWSTEMMATLGMEIKSANTVHELAKVGSTSCCELLVGLGWVGLVLVGLLVCFFVFLFCFLV
jgi:hypothetical protein